jgi:cell volume regulation protein A
MLSGLPNAELYFNVAFFVVLVSLILQGWTINAAARKLKVALTTGTPQVNRVELDLPGQTTFELAGYSIAPDSDILSHGVIPGWATLTLVVREKEILKGSYAGSLKAGDYAYFLVKPEQAQRLDRLFVSSDDLALDTRSIFQKITVEGETTLGHIAEKHGITVQPEHLDKTIADFFCDNGGQDISVGYRISIGVDTFIARKIENGKVLKADLLVENVSEIKKHGNLTQVALTFFKKEMLNIKKYFQ